jgi:predicted nucleic acid-binding Zn ribbon protein
MIEQCPIKPAGVIKYRCEQCAEKFEIAAKPLKGEIHCPRCTSGDIKEFKEEKTEIGPPPWEFRCKQCRSRFRVQSPQGPDEVASLRCPECQSQSLQWLASECAACTTGG